jgi:hypothetical protein
MHTFVIRAVDDDDGRSPAEFLEFTSLNYAPRTTIEGIEGLENHFLVSDLLVSSPGPVACGRPR